MTNSKIHNGGGQTHNLLKSHYKKSLFALIKATKRYYLGIWLIKLPFYAIFSESKAKKYREKRKVRYENLQIAKKRFKTIHKLAPQIKAWVESSEFKEKYANHPYPPLLNPQTLDYESISAELAWELNLPLPPNYDLIYLFAHGAGVYKFRTTMLDCCKMRTCYQQFPSVKNRYLVAYNFLLVGDEFKILEFDIDYKSAEFEKLLTLTTKKVPLLCQVRDPIELLRHALARAGRWGDYKLIKSKEFDLTFGFNDVILPFESLPFNKNLEALKKESYPTMFCINAHLKKLKHISNIEFLDTKDINSSDIVAKFNKIAKKFNLIPLQESHKKSLQSNAFKGSAILIFPLYFYPNLKNKKHFKITITHSSPSSDDFNLYDEIMGGTNKNYGIYIAKSELLSFRAETNIYQATCKYLCNFIQQLEVRFRQEDNAVLKITDIMEYLKNEPIARKNVYKITKDEVAIVKKLRPDIVESWKYYREFEKMCAELDSI